MNTEVLEDALEMTAGELKSPVHALWWQILTILHHSERERPARASPHYEERQQEQRKRSPSPPK